MTSYFVTGHPSALAWAAGEGIVATPVSHWGPQVRVRDGDVVMGTLPVQIIAELTARGVRYLHLELDLPEGMRQQPLTVADMKRFGARLSEFKAERVATNTEPTHE